MVLHFFSIFHSLFLKVVLSRSTDAFQTPPEGQRASMDFREIRTVSALEGFKNWFCSQPDAVRIKIRAEMIAFLVDFEQQDPSRRRRQVDKPSMRRKRRPVRRG